MEHTLDIPRGVTAIIGSGGKTTLMLHLAQRLPGRRIVCTTTKIYPPQQLPIYTGADPAELSCLLDQHGCVCVGQPAAQGKLTLPLCGLDTLAALADYVLVEADGSKHLPLKAHLPGEPVIPPQAAQVLLVVGMTGIGQPICEAVHRPERFAQLTGKTPQAPAEALDVARVILREQLAHAVILNQMDAGDLESAARQLANALPGPVYAGSVRSANLTRLK